MLVALCREIKFKFVQHEIADIFFVAEKFIM